MGQNLRSLISLTYDVFLKCPNCGEVINEAKPIPINFPEFTPAESYKVSALILEQIRIHFSRCKPKHGHAFRVEMPAQ